MFALKKIKKCAIFKKQLFRDFNEVLIYEYCWDKSFEYAWLKILGKWKKLNLTIDIL